jgi:hypothetical protein
VVAAGYRHAEAYCHMRYLADDGTAAVVIWNSRDGVTPFVVTLPDTDNKQGTHVQWDLDHPQPDYVPDVGEWVFVDLTPDAARAYAERNARRYWDDPSVDARAAYASVDDLAETLTASYLDMPGAPDLVQVDEPMRRRFLARRVARR